MISDQQLMTDIQAGQLDRLATLYERYKVKLFNYFLRLGNSRTQSEDLVQETFMKVLAYRTSFNGSASVSSWLYGIARNTAADNYRKSQHSKHHQDIDEQEIEGEHTLCEDYDQNQQQDMFDKSLANISAEHREIIILSRFQQLSYQDIASLLNLNLNTLKSKMRNAISQLHKTYNALSGETHS